MNLVLGTNRVEAFICVFWTINKNNKIVYSLFVTK